MLRSWNLDLVLIGAMAAIACMHLFVLQKHGEWPQKRQAFAATWLLLALLFVSPLCALSSALFSVRVAHHVVLIAVIAPFAVMAMPNRWRCLEIAANALLIILVFHIFVLWSWHAPALYGVALFRPAMFWIMQLSLLGTALLFWLAVLSPRAAFHASMTALLGATMQMGLLGAIITFARIPLYAPHFGSTEPFGLSALEDQQLAGLIMWVPAVLPYLAAALILLKLRLENAALPGRAP